MTTPYVLYEASTGKILQSGFSQDPHALVKAGQSLALGETGTPQIDRVLNGEVIPLPTRPSENHEFNYATSQWEVDAQLAWGKVRIQRQKLLSQSDWIVTKSIEAGVPVPAAWVAYRQALRDITEAGDPLAVAWPTIPA